MIKVPPVSSPAESARFHSAGEGTGGTMTMAIYAYKAIDHLTGGVSGTIAADTPRQAREQLRERGLVVTNVGAVRADRPRERHWFTALRQRRSRSATRHQVTALLRELSTLLSVGVPLLEALQTLARQHRGRFHAVILQLKDRIAAGSSLAGAMAGQPQIFDELCVNIAEVGEDAGTLDTSLDRLAGFRERYEQMRNRLVTALLYPAIVSIIAIFATLFQMTFVVPRILQPLIEQGMPLPLPTRIVKGASDWVLDWWWLLMICALVAAASWSLLLGTPRGRRAWHRVLLKTPLIGELARKQALVQVSVVLSTLLRSGVVFIRALQIAQRTAGNVIIRQALGECETAVSAGSDIGAAMQETEAFPPLFVEVCTLGQQSGRLEEMLDRLAAAYDQQVATATSRLAAVLEPLLIVVLALFVLFIVLATVLPILEAGNAIQ